MQHVVKLKFYIHSQLIATVNTAAVV